MDEVPYIILTTTGGLESLRRTMAVIGPEALTSDTLSSVTIRPDRNCPPAREILRMYFCARYAPQHMPLVEHVHKFTDEQLHAWWRALCDLCAIDPDEWETGERAFSSIARMLLWFGWGGQYLEIIRDEEEARLVGMDTRLANC